MIEPIHELTKIAKAQGSRVLIDGAHAPGVLDIFVEEIGADYYTGNCHKWLFAPKGSAFLWTARHIYHPNLENDAKEFDDPHPQPAVISSTGKYDYLGRFEYTGTRDYIAFCALPSSFAFIEDRLRGFEMMRRYSMTLLKKGCDHLVSEWMTGYLIAPSLNAVMANVILATSSVEQTERLQRRLFDDYRISMVFGAVPAKEGVSGPKGLAIKEIFFIRVSAQVYLELTDFYRLAAAVKALLSMERE